jgi:hypothetical protein
VESLNRAPIGPINLEGYMLDRGWVWSDTLGEYVDVAGCVLGGLPVVEVTFRKADSGDRC